MVSEIFAGRATGTRENGKKGVLSMARKTVTFGSVAEGYLALLGNRGVDYLFGNAGTDFASVIEALSKAASGEFKAPTPITVS